MDESTLVSLVARSLGESGAFRVLVARSSQTRAYFSMGRRRKAPDLIALGAGGLFVFEAKTIPAALFRESNGVSDVGSMKFLSSSVAAQEELRDRLGARVVPRSAMGVRMLCGLLAARPFSPEQVRAAELLICLYWDGKCVVAQGPDGSAPAAEVMRAAGELDNRRRTRGRR